MTGYTVHTGSTQKFAHGWDQIFQGQASKKASQPKHSQKAKTTAQAKSVKKSRKSK